MHRPPHRREPLRRRVSEGRVRREARQRRVYATVRVTKRTIAVLVAVVMVGAFATVTQVASGNSDPAAQFIGVGNECAISTDDLELHVEEETAGVMHYHYRGPGKPKWWWHKVHHHRHGGHKHHKPKPTAEPSPTPDPPTSTEPIGPEPTDDPGIDPTGGPGTGPTNEPGTDPTDEPTTELTPTDEPTEEPPLDEPPSEEPPNITDEDVLGTSCEQSNLPTHDGFQDGPRCVPIAMGEVSEAALNPSLLITAAPTTVAPNEPFTIQVSTSQPGAGPVPARGPGRLLPGELLLTEEALPVVTSTLDAGCWPTRTSLRCPTPNPRSSSRSRTSEVVWSRLRQRRSSGSARARVVPLHGMGRRSEPPGADDAVRSALRSGRRRPDHRRVTSPHRCPG